MRHSQRRPVARTGRISLLAALLLVALGLPLASHAQVVSQEPNRGGDIDLAALDVNVALQRLRPAQGYEVNLFASEQDFPELANPLAMTFDPQGRLWVLTSPTYPHYFPGEPPDDKLVILEDTNGDGRADKLTVFADGLYVPMGFELGDGGVYVSQQPNLMFLRDTNGDGRADHREIILHGFGTEDSHHALSAFTWGPGGGLYFQEGTFLHSQVETPYGPVRVQDAAVFRYEPRTEKLSVFVSYPFANPWGHVVDRWGQNFISDASNGNNYYGTAFSGHMDYPNKHRPMKEWTLTKVRPTSGIEFIRSRHFPDDAQGNFLITNVIGFHGIKQYRVTEDGSGFVGIEVEPLLQSTDINFRPVALQFGPDGALYVVDWFNPLIGHMQYSLRDPRRDHSHGRVWRVTARGRALLERPRIHGQPVEAQLDLLKVYEDRTRYWTRLALREQPTETVVRELPRWIAALDPGHEEYEHHLLEALWVYQHHDMVEQELLKRLLQAGNFRARAAAVRVLHHWFDRVDDGMALLRRMVHDPAPRVRLEAVRALSFIPTSEATEVALEALQHPTDYYLQYVIDATLTTLAKVWRPALTSGRPIAGDNPEGFAFLLDRLSPSELASVPRNTAVLHALLSRSGVEPRHRQHALDGLAQLTRTEPLRELVAAINRIDGRPGSHDATTDLIRLLIASPAPALAAVRGEAERLAVQGRNDVVRQGAFVALMRTEGGLVKAWQLASASPRHLIDLLDGISLLDDQRLLSALPPYIKPLLTDSPAGRTEPAVAGRYVRLVLPGRDRTLALAEVQVFSGGENVAPKGAASQSSTVSGGAIGGHAPRAIDGRTDGRPESESVAFTSQEQDPWWELDLGETRPIDRITIWGRSDERAQALEGLYLSVLDDSRKPVFTRDGVPPPAPSTTVALGGDFTEEVHASALAALSHVPTHEKEVVGLLEEFIRTGTHRVAAIEAIRRIPPERWPSPQIGPLAESLLAYARQVPRAERSGPVFTRAIEAGRELAGRLPAPEGQRINAALDELLVRTIRIVATVGTMKFDIEHFTVEAGEDVEIVLVNPDYMPHNLLITTPGKLEAVSLKAEAMAAEPDAFEKHFVPDTPDVLFATKLLQQGETERLRFTAPSDPGNYPFVCTFPGHWRTMNGIMEVVRPAAPTAER
jgi:glucose/arabinose dehydrogenase/azurin